MFPVTRCVDVGSGCSTWCGRPIPCWAFESAGTWGGYPSRPARRVSFPGTDAFATHLSCAPAAARLDAPVPRTAVARLPAACSVLLALSSKVERAGTQAPLILLALLTCSRPWSESVSMRGARRSSRLTRFSSRLPEEHDLFLFNMHARIEVFFFFYRAAIPARSRVRWLATLSQVTWSSEFLSEVRKFYEGLCTPLLCCQG